VTNGRYGQSVYAYLDESGVGKPGERDQFEYFAFGGILVRKRDEQQLIDALADFKTKWNIPQATPLHASEIRNKKKNFRFLEGLPEQELIEFKTDILLMVLRSNALLHACVVKRDGYLKRYKAVYGQKTWKMLKSATAIVIERAAKLVQVRAGSVRRV